MHTTERKASGAQLTNREVWKAIAKASFAVIGYVTPDGEPRTSGVVYSTSSGSMYVAAAPESWKARHVAAAGRIAVTVPVRRGGVLSLVAPIPPATISFHAAAIVHQPGTAETRSLLEQLGALLPPDRRETASVIEIVPEGEFVTYGIGVPLMKMRDPAVARGRAAVA